MNIFLAVTCNDHKLYGECSESILKNCITLLKNGHTVTPLYYNDLYIDRARNACVNFFLGTNCSDIVFVDSDMSFDDDAILKLMKHNKPIVAGAYRYKKDFEEYSARLDFSHENNCKEESTGLVYVNDAPAGLMRINRTVFEKLMPTTAQDEGGRDMGKYQFFRTGVIIPGDINWWGEDTYFCKTWRDIGGEIFVEPHINFTHYGIKGFSGNYHNYLMGHQVISLERAAGMSIIRQEENK